MPNQKAWVETKQASWSMKYKGSKSFARLPDEGQD